MDPLKHNLFFERFLNPGRNDPPDIDIDFPWDERDNILRWVFEQYGERQAAMVANHNSVGFRAALHETAKVYGMPAEDRSHPGSSATSIYCHSMNPRHTANG